MELVVGVALTAAAAVVGVRGWLWHTSPERTHRRRLRAMTRLAWDARVEDGAAVKVVGRATPVGYPTRAPLSGREGVAWRLLAEEVPRYKGGWTTLFERTQGTDFGLAEGDARCLVRWGDARLVGDFDRVERVGFLRDPSPAAAELLRSYGCEVTDWRGMNRAIRIRELVLPVGCTLSVAGEASREVDPAPPAEGYRERPTRLVVGEPAVGPLLVSNDPSTFR